MLCAPTRTAFIHPPHATRAVLRARSVCRGALECFRLRPLHSLSSAASPRLKLRAPSRPRRDPGSSRRLQRRAPRDLPAVHTSRWTGTWPPAGSRYMASTRAGWYSTWVRQEPWTGPSSTGRQPMPRSTRSRAPTTAWPGPRSRPRRAVCSVTALTKSTSQVRTASSACWESSAAPGTPGATPYGRWKSTEPLRRTATVTGSTTRSTSALTLLLERGWTAWAARSSSPATRSPSQAASS